MDVVATPVSSGLLANNPDVRTVVVYDKRGTARGIRGFKHTANALRDCGAASTAYLAQGSIAQRYTRLCRWRAQSRGDSLHPRGARAVLPRGAIS